MADPSPSPKTQTVSAQMKNQRYLLISEVEQELGKLERKKSADSEGIVVAMVIAVRRSFT